MAKTKKRKNGVQEPADEEWLKDVGYRMYRIRKRHKLSLREVSALTGLDNSKLAKIEKGQINITLLALHQFCKGLEISEKRFFAYQ